MKKVALVLSGGSIKGAFQAGAIKTILDNDYVPSSIHGISIGSLNGAFLANKAGQDGNGQLPWKTYAQDLQDFWFEKITSFSAIGKKRSKICIFWDVIRGKYKSLIKTEKLQRLIRELFDEESLKACPIPFYAGTVNIQTGELVNARSQSYPSNLIDYIIASTAIPVVMPISNISGQPFLDGGLIDVVPLKNAIDSGAETIFCVLCQPSKLDDVQFNTGNLLQLMNRLMEIIVNETVNNDVQRAEKINRTIRSISPEANTDENTGHRIIDIKVIRPEKTLDINLTNFNENDIKSIFELGKSRAKEVLEIA